MSEAPALEPKLVWSRESRFVCETFDDVRPITRPGIIKGILPTRGVAFMVGASKAGKTFVSIDAMLRVAAGRPAVWGRKIKQCGVVYLAAEDPDGCRNRVVAWRKKWGSYLPEGIPFDLFSPGVNLLDADDVAALMVDLEARKAVMAAAGHRLGIVVVDTLSRCIPGADENSSESMSLALRALEEIGRHLDVLIVVVAHYGKGGQERGIRGWSGMDAASDATISVERDKEDPEKRVITFDKVKNGRDGGALGFELEEVTLGITDEDGEELSSCVVNYTGAPTTTTRGSKRASLKPHEEIVLNAIRYVTDHGPHHPLTYEGVKPHHKGLSRADVKARAYVTGFGAEAEKQNTRDQRFGRALETLISHKKIRKEGDLIWLL